MTTSVLLTLAALLFQGCGRETSERQQPSRGPGKLAVVFRIGGDDFAEEEALSQARALGRKIEGAGLGRLVSWSTGMGKMELQFSVADRRSARDRIEAFLQSERPPWKFSVEEVAGTQGRSLGSRPGWSKRTQFGNLGLTRNSELATRDWSESRMFIDRL